MEAVNTEVELKVERARALLDRHQANGLLLRRVSSFAWATGGAASYVNTAISEGAASLLITPDRRCLITNNIEAPRLEEEAGLAAQGWELRVSPWHNPTQALDASIAGLNLVADVEFPGAKNVGGELARLRAALLPEEANRFRQLGRLCAAAMDAAARSVRPGMSEVQIAARLGGEAQRLGVQPIVNLIAVDERIYRYRHPLPTGRVLERYALLVLSGRKWGLVCSISRLVHFGPIPTELKARQMATLQVNAAFIGQTAAGRTLGEIFEAGRAAYAAVGCPDEWQRHHQGGVVGYEPREYLATPGSTDRVSVGQALSWNPSIAGAKAEDTILVGEQGCEILTAIPGWPVQPVAAPGSHREIACPLALEIK